MNRLNFQTAATKEALAAADYYAARDAAVAKRFQVEFNRSLKLIEESGGRFAVAPDGTRHVHLAGFPYSIIYRDLTQGVEIVAVMHDRRRPNYWKKRLK